VKRIIRSAVAALLCAALATPLSATKDQTRYTVYVSVDPGSAKGGGATVTLYGTQGYWAQRVTPGDYGTHTVAFPNVPGGKGVVCRIDIDLQDGTHRSVYEQQVYSYWYDTVGWTYQV